MTLHITTLIGTRVLRSEMTTPATQWLGLGFAVHPLMRNSKGWDPRYRDMDLELRATTVENDPTPWDRLGVEPGSSRVTQRWIVIDDDSHKDKFDDDQKDAVRQALWMLFRDQSTKPDATGADRNKRLTRALTNVPTIRTPSGGSHYFFRYNGPSFGAMNLPGLDILCETNVATWPTPGYQIGVGFSKPFDEYPEVTQPQLQSMAEMLRPAPSAAIDGSPDAIRARGRNNYARNLLWRTCMASLRVHTDRDKARIDAKGAWDEQVEALSRLLGGEMPSEWGVDPDKDFIRTWDKAEAAHQHLSDIGVTFEDGYIRTLCRNKDGMSYQQGLLDRPLSMIRTEMVLAGPPEHRVASGIRIEDMDGGSYFLDYSRMGTAQSVTSALAPIQVMKAKDAVFKDTLFEWQAVSIGLQLSALGTNLVMPTGVWWRREWPADLVELVPTAEWAFYADDVILPTGETDPRASVTPIQAHQVMQAAGVINHVPWKLRPDCDRKAVSEFCRTLAGFAQDDAAARAVVLPALGIIRGWLRGSTRLGSSQPFVSIEGPTGAGKTTGIFTAALALAGVESASGYKTQAVFSTEMTQSRCGMLVMDDQDINAEWGELLRIQQVEGAWSKANAMRHLLGTTVLVSQGLPILENDQALQDRVFRIDVPEVRDRRSLLNPKMLQEKDLHQIGRDKALALQGGWTRSVIQAMGMVDVEEAVESVWEHWSGRKRLASRQRLIMASAELSARIYCWIAAGCNPKLRWWDAAPKKLVIELEDGSTLNAIQILRDTAEEDALARKTSSPLAMVITEYIQRVPNMNWDRTGEPNDHVGWCQQFPAWIRNGRLEIRVAPLSRWAQSQRWPNGVRPQLFSVKQFHSELDGLGASGMQNSQKFGVRYRACSPGKTTELLENSLEWATKNVDEGLGIDDDL